MKRWLGLSALLLLVGGVEVTQGQSAPSLQGVWRVTEIVVTGANASTNKSPQPGFYVFTKQHYSIITVNGTTPRKDIVQAKDPNKLTDAEKIARFDAWSPFTANSGTYQISGSTLTTRVMVAKNPNVMAGTGPGQTREFKIDGNTLTLIQKSGANQPASVTTTKLTRIE